jgi:hypothetical protein
MTDGILRYVAIKNIRLLAARVFGLVESPTAMKQNSLRDFDEIKGNIPGGYFLLYHVRHGRPKDTCKIAVVTYLTRNALLFAIWNDKYLFDQPDKDCYLLHRPE